MNFNNTMLVVAGFVTSFIAGWIVVRSFLGYVARHGFSLFGWWRVIVGSLGLAALIILR
jgi:undecaprenyl-diphosphatase